MSATTSNSVDGLYRISAVDGSMPMLAHDQLTADEARREGALACMRAMANLIKSAENYCSTPERSTNTEAAEEFYERRANDAKALADALGPISSFHEGAILALAEYLHEIFTTGAADPDSWTPRAAMTPNQYREEIARMVSAMEGE